jgi:exonuclease III
LHELDHNFSIIGISETRIINTGSLDFNPNIPGYNFEYVPTPLSAGGVGMYIDDNLNYRIIEKRSNEAFQALWIEIEFTDNDNNTCAVIYRQHNSPECFQSYFEDILEKLSTTNKPIYILGDFNIYLLRFETCKYAHNSLISLQSYGFSPIDKPTRVHNNSATLIDNILIRNDSNFVIISGK